MTRWGSLLLVLVGAGCSGATDPASSPDAAAVADTTVDDTAMSDADSMNVDGSETDSSEARPFAQLAFVNLAPDRPPAFLCFLHFVPTDTQMSKPVAANSPIGRMPLPGEPATPLAGIPGWEAISGPVPLALADVLESMPTVAVAAVTADATQTCQAQWPSIKPRRENWVTLPNSLARPYSLLIAHVICEGAPSCTTANNGLRVVQLDARETTAAVHVQVVNLAAWNSFQKLVPELSGMKLSSSPLAFGAASARAALATTPVALAASELWVKQVECTVGCAEIAFPLGDRMTAAKRWSPDGTRNWTFVVHGDSAPALMALPARP